MKNVRKEIMVPVKKVLIKIGSAVLAGDDGLDIAIIQQFADEIAGLKDEGYQIIIVTSGAIASGKHRMGIAGPLKSIPQKQAAAAIGQGRLMRVYANAFRAHGIYVAQILLTMSDLTDRKRFLNIRNTLSTLVEWGVIPVINENDTVAVEEIKFGDNDHLAAMMANLIETHLVINLTSTDGLYDRNPATSKEARLIPLIREFTEEIEVAATDDTTALGLGGMKSKVMAAKKVTACGIPYVIAPGKEKGILKAIFAGKEKGTLFLPTGERMNSRKYWIAFTLQPRGRLFLDEGAKKAILEKGKSLLPSGVIGAEGNFAAGDAVSCVDCKGNLVGVGLVNYSAAEILRIMGLKTSEVEQALGYKDCDEVIHRDNMSVMGKSGKRNQLLSAKTDSLRHKGTE